MSRKSLMEKVYIVVLNYNRRDDTLECVRSLYDMDYPDFRVLVVDNASTDGSARAVREAFPRAEVIENQENLMYAGGNNAGIRNALSEGADWILLINNDTVVHPAMLTEMMRALEGFPGAGMAGPMIYYYPPKQDGPETIWYAGGVVELWMGLTAHRGIREADRGQYAGVEETAYVTGCGMLISRECIEKVGMLDTSFTMYAEDADLSLRAKKAGFKLLFVPGAVMWHKVSMSAGGEFGAYKLRHKARSNLLLFARHAKPWHWLTAPPLVLVRIILQFIKHI